MNYIKNPKTIILTALIFLFACQHEENTILTNNLRILKVTANGERITEDAASLDNKNLIIKLIFSNSLNIPAFENALSISGSPDFSIRYDSTHSFVTLTFPKLDFDTDYAIHLPKGNYGAEEEVLKNDFTLHFSTKSFVPPVITLSSDPTTLLEGDSTILTATLNKATIDDVIARLQFEGTAQDETDYSISADSIIIPKGQTAASITLNALADADIEGAEMLKVTLAGVSGAVEKDAQEISFTIKDGVAALILKGILALRWDSEPGGSSGKAIHLVAAEDIPDLSVYGLGIANNGGGSDSKEFTFPSIAVTAGEDILVARDPQALEAYFGTAGYAKFEHVIQSDAMAQNGDDAIELYKENAVIETYGAVNVDGTGQDWEYKGSWAYKLGDDWITAPVGCAAGSTTSIGSDCVYPACAQPLILKGVMALRWATETDGSSGKAIHLVALEDIADLSQYSLGIANNGGGTDGIEYTLPGISVSEGDNILIARDPNALSAYFGTCFNIFDQVIQSDAMNQNGDDAIELFSGTTVIEIFGDANVDGTGQAWEYKGSWAYKAAGKWMYGGIGCAASATSNQNATCIYPLCK